MMLGALLSWLRRHEALELSSQIAMDEPVLKFVDCPGAVAVHRMAYWQWGDPSCGHIILCVHGLTRQGRDFDSLARALVTAAGDEICVVCPDVAGRGHSDWLKQAHEYQIPVYASDMLALVARLQPRQLDFVGTSMGGLIGIVIAGQPSVLGQLGIGRLVLNDVGPTMEWAALQRIGQYVGKPTVFDSAEQAAAALWQIAKGFGPHTPQQWLALTLPNLRPVSDRSGRLTLHYDPALGEPFQASTPEDVARGEAMLWQFYDQIKASTLLIRGAESDLLSHETAEAMTRRGPCARLVEFPGVGHAPTFVPPEQARVVVDFLLA